MTVTSSYLVWQLCLHVCRFLCKHTSRLKNIRSTISNTEQRKSSLHLIIIKGHKGRVHPFLSYLLLLQKFLFLFQQCWTDISIFITKTWSPSVWLSLYNFTSFCSYCSAVIALGDDFKTRINLQCRQTDTHQHPKKIESSNLVFSSLIFATKRLNKKGLIDFDVQHF